MPLREFELNYLIDSQPCDWTHFDSSSTLFWPSVKEGNMNTGKVLKHLWRDQQKFSNTARERATLKSIEASNIVCKSLPIADRSTSSSASFLLYVVWNNCICSLLDWSPHEDNPIIIPSLEAFGENRAQPQTLSLEIINSRIYHKSWIKTWSM